MEETEFKEGTTDQDQALATPSFNRAALEEYRRQFLQRYPDFKNFQQQDGGYFVDERNYKEKLLRRAHDALSEINDEHKLGARLLDILTGKAGAFSNLLSWQTNDRVTKLRKTHPDVLERAAGRLANESDIEAAIARFVEETWPTMLEGQTSKPYSESRNIPSMLAALVHPKRAFGINTEPVQKTVQYLSGRKPFGWNPMTTHEYADVLKVVQTIWNIMGEWDWAPRDFWDVQGFIWAVNHTHVQSLSEQSSGPKTKEPISMSTNLILYGPPGTGKTFQTAKEAVGLCGGPVPADCEDPEGRKELMNTYRKLSDAGRIKFVTFHQSTSYEDFVEGLRPTQTNDGAAGFELMPRLGVFREIAELAANSAGQITGRRVFKMSIGEANKDGNTEFFNEAIAGHYTVLGYEDIDWSEERFADIKEIQKAVEEYTGEPTESSSGKVRMPSRFRNDLSIGDIVVVSKGNSLFRAIGEVTGDYQFVQREGGGYCHRRAVRWIWNDPKGVPVNEIYNSNFQQQAIYKLDGAKLKWSALEAYIKPSSTSDIARKPYVLIIDEINRANISKVFGELITLIEPDKRIGKDNALTVQLPYSGDIFGVPQNLHIIGTMNTADRSIALLDTALRRRFEFKELMPQPGKLKPVAGIDLPTLLTTINNRIEYLFDREHQIGHAYFMRCETREQVDNVMRHKVIPLLAEYFYEDWAKVAAVLGDGDDQKGFLTRELLAAPKGMGADEDTSPRYRWSVRKDGFTYDGLATK